MISQCQDEKEVRYRGVALVEQEPFFFEGTLYDNICMGRTGISIDDIMHYLGILHMSHLFPTQESLTEKKEMFDILVHEETLYENK